MAFCRSIYSGLRLRPAIICNKPAIFVTINLVPGYLAMPFPMHSDNEAERKLSSW